MAARAGAGNMSELDSNLHILKNMLKGHTEADFTESVSELAQNVSEYCADDSELKQKICSIMVEFIGMDNEIRHHIDSLSHIKSLNPDTPNLVNCLEDKLRELRQAEADPLEHPKYIEIVEKMSSTSDVETQLATLKATILGESQDDDIEMTQNEINIKCPYSGKTMVSPVMNTKCKHVYDQEAILEYIRLRKNKAKCPVGGCGNTLPIHSSHLKEHKDLKRYIALLSKQR